MRLSPLLSSLLALSALVACEPVEVANLDGDGDGVDAELDCNDANPRVYPGAREVCNGTDDDCDGNVDEDVTQEFWADTDHDGYGDPFNTIDACFVSAGIVQNALDCDDTNIDVRPFAVEQWYDGRDQNCDSLDDFDQDGDGFYPTVYQDAYLAYIQRTGRTALKVGDCDDTQSDVNPFGEEICNNRDDDCNGLRDDGLPQRYYDADQDGFGDPRIHTCATGPLWAEDGSDCDDTNKARYPGVAITVCGDGVDDDCDSYDEPCSPISCFADLDQDGHGDALAIIDDPRLCGGPKTAFLASDCDDTMLWRNPEAVELCGDQVDNDCNGVADDGCPVYLCWADADGDHYGDPYQRLDSSLCGSVGSSWNERDCDDSNQWVNPRGAGQCGDAIDNNCDGQVDEGCTGVECWADADLDGFGDGSAKLSPTACGTSGSAWNHTDCDDTSSAIRPNRRGLRRLDHPGLRRGLLARRGRRRLRRPERAHAPTRGCLRPNAGGGRQRARLRRRLRHREPEHPRELRGHPRQQLRRAGERGLRHRRVLPRHRLRRAWRPGAAPVGHHLPVHQRRLHSGRRLRRHRSLLLPRGDGAVR